MSDAQKDEGEDTPRGERTPLLEWAVGAVGGVAIAAMVGYLVWDGLTATGTPPDIRIIPSLAIQTEGGYLVPFVARNLGDTTAAAVRIEGVLRDASGPPGSQMGTAETSVVVLDYLPRGGEARGGLIFRENPADRVLALRAQGYAAP